MTTVDVQSDESRPQSLTLIMVAIGITVVLSSMGQTVVGTAIPVIVADLGGLDQLTWVVTSYLLTSTIASPVFGKLGDLYGRKIMLQFGIVVFMIGSVISGLAPDVLTMVIGRAIQGIGGGGLMVAAMTVIADVMPPRERGRAQGRMGGALGIATILGPTTGGFIAQYISWEWIFFINVPFSLASLAVISIALPKIKTERRPKIDYAGATLMTALLTAIVLIATLGGVSLAWGSAEILGLTGFAIIATLAFIWAERRAPEPMVPLSLFSNVNYLVANTTAFLLSVTMFSIFVFMPIYYQLIKGVGAMVSGLLVMPMMLTFLTTSIFCGALITRTGRYKAMMTWAFVSVTIGIGGLSFLTPQTPYFLPVVLVILVGLGMGPINTIGMTAIQNSVPGNMVGVATASINMFRSVGSAIGVAVFGGVFAAGLMRRLGDVLPAGMSPHELNRAFLVTLDPAVQGPVLVGVSQAISPIFMLAAAASAICVILSLFMTEVMD
ncbi:MAG: MDR family MFS transporter [Paracoccaceae bacterium]